MNTSQIAEPARERLDRVLLSDGDAGSQPIMVPAAGVLDLLVAIKLHLTVVAKSGILGPSDPQARVDKACETIDAAVGELKRLPGLCPANGKGSPIGPNGDLK